MRLSRTLWALSAAAMFSAAPLIHAQEAATAPKEPAFKAHVLTRAEFDALLVHPEKVLLIDLRRPDELTSIGGFGVYLSVQIKDLENSLAFIPKERQIVTVSNHAARAGRAADLLASRGFNVAGAIGAQVYESEGGTLVHIAKPETPAAPAR